jgi:predicted amidohydrolase
MKPRLGDLEANLTAHLDAIDKARAKGVELLLFPELSLTGYYVKDLVAEVARSADCAELRRLSEAAGPMDLAVGFVEVDARARYFIAAAYLSGGRPVHVHRKVYLPAYGIFDDHRFFSPGRQARAFDTRFGRAAMLICEDYWHLSMPYLMWMDGADLFLFLAASPGRGLDQRSLQIASEGVMRGLATSYATTCVAPVFLCNRVGWEDGINFWGGSLAVDAGGALVACAPPLEETLLIVDYDPAVTRRQRTGSPFVGDEDLDLTWRELDRIRRREYDL